MKQRLCYLVCVPPTPPSSSRSLVSRLDVVDCIETVFVVAPSLSVAVTVVAPHYTCSKASRLDRRRGFSIFFLTSQRPGRSRLACDFSDPLSQNVAVLIRGAS